MLLRQQYRPLRQRLLLHLHHHHRRLLRPTLDMPTRTVMAPMTQMSGGPTQTSWSVTRDCGMNPVSTVIAPITKGPPTCGTRTVTIGQTCMSVIREAGMKLIRTVGKPRITVPPCAVMLVMVAAGIPMD